MEGTAEFFSFPQRWAVGVEREDFDGDTFKTYLNRILALSADSEGRNPQVGTFSAASPEPHIAQLRASRRFLRIFWGLFRIIRRLLRRFWRLRLIWSRLLSVLRGCLVLRGVR